MKSHACSIGVLALALAGSLAGCGGSSTANSTSIVGSWTEATASGHETHLTISSNGAVNGSTLNFQIGGHDILTGTRQANGSFSGRIANDNQPNVTYTVSGTIVFLSDPSQIRVTYTGNFGAATYTTDVVMHRG